VHLEGFERRLPGELSGGQQQRVALARALVFEPPVLLMDEPLGALDKKLRDAMQKEIKQLQMALGITTIYVTHDQEEALTMSDRIVVMNQGRIAQVGSPQEVYERPASRFVADFMGATNFLRGEVLEPGTPMIVRTRSGTRIAVESSRRWGRGDGVLMVIRPERVRVRPVTGEEGVARGRVRDVVYTGGARRYDIDLGDGEALAALELNHGGPPLEAGRSVEVAWKSDDAWVVPDDEEAETEADAGDDGASQSMPPQSIR